MKEILLQYAKYNLWANKRIIDILLKLDAGQLEQEITSSFPSIRQTVYHTWSAESIWLQRLQLAEQPIWLEDSFAGSFEDACADWQRASEGLIEFIERQFDERSFQHVFQYYTTDKQSRKLPVFTALNHVINHSTHHRGQIITMLRQVGVSKIPVTDLSVFTIK
jgi:uncharacterized damage-inducible protein DinB